MPGNNAGNQLNLFVFELGMRTSDPEGTLPDIVQSVTVHPLMVVPHLIRYTDGRLGTVTQTHDGAVRTVAGRALWNLTLQGTFGVESRGLGPFVGTGEVRFQRFWHEIVRMSEASNRAQVDAERSLIRSPFDIPVQVATRGYDPERSSFFVNFYDLYNDVASEVSITQFVPERRANGGGASGQVHYSVQIQQVGPIVVAGPGNLVIQSLFQALTTWDQVNQFLASYTLESVSDSFVGAAAVLTRQVAETFQATQAQVNSQVVDATGLLDGFKTGRGTTLVDEDDEDAVDLSNYLGTTEELQTTAADLAQTVALASGTQILADPGSVKWDALKGEGQVDAIEAAERIDELHEIIDSAAWQRVAGKLYGMSAAEYRALLEATGQLGRRSNLAGSITHRVKAWDTPDSLERQFGVTFDQILELNRLLPNEALLVGTELQIPRDRQIGPQSYIDGLPVFGSHSGQAAWGADLYMDLRATPDGDLDVVSGPEVLVQGMEWLMEANGPELLDFVNSGPDVVSEAGDSRRILMRKRVAALLETDKRVSAVQDVQVNITDSGAVALDATVVAINGGTISTVRT